MNTNMSRRHFVQTTALAVAGAAVATHAQPKSGVNWPIGVFNRPWMQQFGTKTQPITVPQKANWGVAVALRGAEEAGYKLFGLLTSMPDDPFNGSNATPQYLSALKSKIAAHKLHANMCALRQKDSLPLDEQIKDVRKQVDNAHTLGAEWLLTFGVEKPEHYPTYYKLMADTADYCADKKIKLVMKPHGGGSGSSEEILRCIKAVNKPNFKIWYDAGNIIYYTGKDPVEQLKPVAQYVTGFCAKDCDKQKGDVFVQFGQGKVNFPAVFGELKKAGYNGPVMVECAAGKTFEEVTENAKANRLFLEKVFAAL
jgi:sugar phosphate isomerase/epimerase